MAQVKISSRLDIREKLHSFQDDTLLTAREAAGVIPCSHIALLRRLHRFNSGVTSGENLPKFVKLGQQYRFRVGDLKAWQCSVGGVAKPVEPAECTRAAKGRPRRPVAGFDGTLIASPGWTE